MSIITVPVTLKAFDQSGNPVVGARVLAKLNQTEVDQGFVVPEQVEAFTDGNGVAVLNLWPNELGLASSTYRIRAWNPDTGSKFLDATAVIPNSPCNFEQVILRQPYPSVDAAEAALLEMQEGLAVVTSKIASIVEMEASVSEAAAQAALSQSVAQTAATQGSVSAEVAQNHASGAAASAVLAANMATQASNDSANATEKAGDAAASALSAQASSVSASGSAAAAGASASAAQLSATTAAAARSGAENARDAANAKASEAAASATSAASSATTATTKASEAATSATNAAASATAAASSASNAESAVTAHVGTADPHTQYIQKTGGTFSGAVTYSPGTANGVLFLNGSKLVSSGNALSFDGTNLNVGGGTAVSATSGGSFTGGLVAVRSALTAHQTATGVLQYTANETTLRSYGATGVTGSLVFNLGAGGAADAEFMRLTSVGLGIGTSLPGAKLDTVGVMRGTFNSASNGGPGSHGLELRQSSTSTKALIAGYSTSGNQIGAYIQAVNFGTAYEDLVLQPQAGNLGLGVTPSAWGSGTRAMQVGASSTTGFFISGSTNGVFGTNTYYDGSVYRYINSAVASRYTQEGDGAHKWHTAPSGTAGTPISFTQAMTLSGTSTPALRVGVTADLSGFNFQAANTVGFSVHNLGSTATAAYYSAAGNVTLTASGNFAVINGADGILFGATSTERARITAGGNLLVGTTVDNGRFTVLTQPGSIGRIVSLASVNGSGPGAALDATNEAGTLQEPLALRGSELYFRTLTTERARITSGGYFKASNTGTYVRADGVNLAAENQYNFLSSANGDSVSVSNNNTGSAVNNIYSYLATGATGFHFSANLNTTKVYQVLANGNVQNTNNSYGAISDLKLKENITDATPKLASLNQLRVVNYNLKTDPGFKQIGLIAQEVEQVFPGLVESTQDIDPETKEPTGTVTKAVKYSVLVPMLLKAVQEQTQTIAALTARVAALENA